MIRPFGSPLTSKYVGGWKKAPCMRLQNEGIARGGFHQTCLVLPLPNMAWVRTIKGSYPFPDWIWCGKIFIFRMSHVNSYHHTWLFSLRSDCSRNLGICLVGIGASKSSKLTIHLFSAIIKNTLWAWLFAKTNSCFNCNLRPVYRMFESVNKVWPNASKWHSWSHPKLQLLLSKLATTWVLVFGQ